MSEQSEQSKQREKYSELSYVQILDKVQGYFSSTYYELLSQNTEGSNEDSKKLLKKNIEDYLKQNRVACLEEKKMSKLVSKLYNSMCKYDFLTPYLFDDAFITEHGIEEVNGNAWNSVYVTDKTGTHLIEEHFPSPKHALNTMNSLAVRLNKSLNDTSPRFLGEVRKNVRVACSCVPIVTAEAAVDFSVRIVSLKNLTRTQLLSLGTLDDDGLTLLEMCLHYGQNVCISGATSSGKTATMAYLLTYLADNTSKRIASIEIEAREFNILRCDENGRVLNNVISWCTRESDSEAYRISSDNLEELVLRYDPQVIAVGEMRNKEALITCEIAGTGMAVITTTHADSAVNTYHRMVMLCKKAQMGYDDDTLYRLVLNAFPIVAFQEQMEDGTRKVTEIIEGIDYKDGRLSYRTLAEYVLDTSTQELVTGRFTKGVGISQQLSDRLRKKGAGAQLIGRFKVGG